MSIHLVLLPITATRYRWDQYGDGWDAVQAAFDNYATFDPEAHDYATSGPLYAYQGHEIQIVMHQRARDTTCTIPAQFMADAMGITITIEDRTYAFARMEIEEKMSDGQHYRTITLYFS